jgi:hypothetical protein
LTLIRNMHNAKGEVLCPTLQTQSTTRNLRFHPFSLSNASYTNKNQNQDYWRSEMKLEIKPDPFLLGIGETTNRLQKSLVLP